MSQDDKERGNIVGVIDPGSSKSSPSGCEQGLDPLIAIMTRLDNLLASLGNNPALGQLPEARFRPDNEECMIRRSRSSLPDPRMIRNIIKARQMRPRFLDADLFADPAWDMLLDLTAARSEHRRVSVTSLCIASGVPTTTALRWMKLLEQAGYIQRMEDDTDRRRAFVALSESGAAAMARYFEAAIKIWNEIP